jgi:flagellar basal-body rod modification protein FlgD
MAVSTPPPITSNVTSAITPSTASPANAAGAGKSSIADNFQAFLRLLTTQLKHQNPLDPLDTNQFTQQLVQFAQVEQQLKSNDQLAKLVALEQTAQATYALAFVGQTVVVDGATAPLRSGKAVWDLSVPKPSTAVITITSATGQTVYSGAFTMGAGRQPFVWDGRDASGRQWPDGNYTISVVAQDANRQPVAITTEIEGTVESIDLTQSPPALSVGGQSYSLDKVKRLVRNGG